MKETDKKILNILQEDSKLSYKEISNKTNMAPSTIHFRVQKLLEEGIIKRFSIKLDLEKLGYQADAWVGLTVDPLKIDPIAAQLAQFSQILKVFSTTGDHNLIIQVLAENEKNLWRFLRKKVQSIEGVDPQMNVSIKLDSYKWTDTIPL